jgi:hypothetical protein
VTSIYRVNTTIQAGSQKTIAQNVGGNGGVVLGLDVRWVGTTRNAAQTTYVQAGVFFDIYDAFGRRFITNKGQSADPILLSSGERWDWASADLADFYGVESIHLGAVKRGPNVDPNIIGFFRNSITISAAVEVAGVPHSIGVGVEYYVFGV